jgi:uncharacterized protein YodC (DUF2158 family)
VADFRTGDVVQLKSGGPSLVVLEVKGEAVTCIWFDADHHVQQATFGGELLTEPARKPTGTPARAPAAPARKPAAR